MVKNKNCGLKIHSSYHPTKKEQLSSPLLTWQLQEQQQTKASLPPSSECIITQTNTCAHAHTKICRRFRRLEGKCPTRQGCARAKRRWHPPPSELLSAAVERREANAPGGKGGGGGGRGRASAREAEKRARSAQLASPFFSAASRGWLGTTSECSRQPRFFSRLTPCFTPSCLWKQKRGCRESHGRNKEVAGGWAPYIPVSSPPPLNAAMPPPLVPPRPPVLRPAPLPLQERESGA